MQRGSFCVAPHLDPLGCSVMPWERMKEGSKQAAAAASYISKQ